MLVRYAKRHPRTYHGGATTSHGTDPDPSRGTHTCMTTHTRKTGNGRRTPRTSANDSSRRNPHTVNTTQHSLQSTHSLRDTPFFKQKVRMSKSHYEWRSIKIYHLIMCVINAFISKSMFNLKGICTSQTSKYVFGVFTYLSYRFHTHMNNRGA